MLVFRELKHLLMEVISSPAMMARGRLLCIQNHLAMVSDNLWVINSMIVISEMGLLYNTILKWLRRLDRVVFAVPAEFTDWKTDVAAAVIDVGELLSRILDWEASSHCSITGDTQQAHFRRLILVELKEILCHLNSLVLRGSAMGLRRDPMGSMNPLQEDYSIVLKNEVVGREEDLEKLFAIIQRQQLVPSNNNGDDSGPFVIAIIGEEWVGKTTLAHMIYHHTWVRQQFHHRIWVDIPILSTFKPIDIISIEFARSIINEECCDQKLHPELPLQAIWEFINEQLGGSRYLLVLHFEDLATLVQNEWIELKSILLRVGGPGSVVLITHQSKTQSVRSVSFLNWENDITTYCLNPLSEDAWLELFKRDTAFTTIPSKQDKSEAMIFAKRHFQNLFQQPFWAKIFGSLSHDIQATLPAPLPPLPEAFYFLKDLPLFLVRQLQYDRLLDSDDYDVMARMLTIEFLVPVENVKIGWSGRYEMFYEEIQELSKLLSQRMVYLHMKVPEDSTTISRCCRYLRLEINPGALPFRLPTMPVEVSNKLIALILQEDEEATLEVSEKKRTKAAAAISKFLNKMLVRLVHLRMLVVETSMIPNLPEQVSKLVNLRYLQLSKLKMELLPKSLLDLPNLRILILLCCEKLQKIPERIHELKKLQILKVAYCTKLQRLPKSITRLTNLEELNVEGCCWLSELPEDLISFKSLRILNVSGCASLSRIPCGIEQLMGLRRLSGIFIGGGFGLAQLQVLTNLQRIGLRNLERAEETQTEVLMGQPDLMELSLHWGGEEANESSESARPLQVLEAFRLNVHVLQELEIISYKGVKFPTWMMSKQQLARFHFLAEVRLINLRRCATLPSLGQLPSLRKLEISGMDLITQIDDTFYGDGDIFPKLKELTLSEMLVLEKLTVPERENAKLSPKLEKLTLIQCPKLKEIDMLCDSNFIMRIWLNNETIWSADFCNWDNLQWIQIISIVGCQELRCLPQSMRSLKRLTNMTVNSCNNLTTLIALDSLEKLYLYACPVLAFNLQVFTKLKRYTIKGCPKMKKANNYLEGKRKGGRR